MRKPFFTYLQTLHYGPKRIKKVAPPISTRVSRKVYFRPMISPSLPKNRAPKGRTIKPAAKVARVERRAAVGFTSGKNFWAMIVDRLPNM